MSSYSETQINRPGVGLGAHGPLTISVAPVRFLLKDLGLLFLSLILLRGSLAAGRAK